MYLVNASAGEQKGVVSDTNVIFEIIRENTDIPCAVELGNATPEQVERFSAIADGVIVRGIFRK